MRTIFEIKNFLALARKGGGIFVPIYREGGKGGERMTASHLRAHCPPSRSSLAYLAGQETMMDENDGDGRKWKQMNPLFACFVTLKLWAGQALILLSLYTYNQGKTSLI